MKRRVKSYRRAMVITTSLLMLVVFVWLTAIAFFRFYPDKARDISYLVVRVKGAFAHYLLQERPRFYYLVLEKNGEEIKLLANDNLKISYRDIFVIKDIGSDDLTGRHTTVDVLGLGGENDFRIFLKGQELVDKAIEARLRAGENSFPSQISVAYKGEITATLPVIIEITPQDWLRHARATDDITLQIDFLERALAMNSQDHALRKTLAGLYEKKGMIKEAIDQYKRILRENKADLRARHDLVRLYLSINDHKQIIQESAAILKANPADQGAKINMAYAYKNLGDWEKAIEYYKSALQDKKVDPSVHYQLGEVYEKVKRWGEAIEQYRLVVSLLPNDLNAKIALADTCLKAGHHDEAIKWYQEILKHKQLASIYANLGVAYGSKGLIKEEIESYKKSLKLNPKDHVVLFNLAVAYENNKSDKEAAVEYRKLLKMRPGDRVIIERLAHLEFKNKKYDGAIKLYQQIVKTSSEKKRIYANLGFAYGELKKYDESAKCYEQALKLGLQDPQIHYNLAVTYGLLNKKEQAIGEYEKYALFAPTKEVLLILADYYLSNNNYDKAIKNYLRLVRDDPKDDNLFYQLALAYEKSGAYSEALNYYTTAFEMHPSAERAAKIREMKVKIIELKHKERTR